MNTFIRTKQHKKERKKNSTKTAVYSLAYMYINKWYTKSTAEHCCMNTVLNILSLV